jgi:hypothetical protein
VRQIHLPKPRKTTVDLPGLQLPAPHKKTEVFATSRRAAANVGARQPDKTLLFFEKVNAATRQNPTFFAEIAGLLLRMS